MKRFAAVAAVVAACVFQQIGSAQSALGQLEQQLQGGAASPAAGATEPPARGYLGADFDDDEVNQGKGVLITGVRPGAAAETGGLKAGDLITSINGRSVKNLKDYDAVAGGPPGTRLQMMVERSGRLQPLTIMLGAKPTAGGPASSPPTSGEPSLSAPSLTAPGASPGSVPGSEPSAPGTFAPGSLAPPDSPSASTLPAPGTPGGSAAGGIRAQPLELGSPPPSTIGDEAPPAGGGATTAPATGGPSIGISVKPLTDQERARAGVPVRRGALIFAVKPGGPADQAGLPVNGVVVRFDGRPIESDSDLINAVKASQPGQEVEISYYEGSRLGRKTLRLAPSSGAVAPGAGLPPPPSSYGTPPGGGYGGRSLMSRVDDAQPRPAATTTVWNPLAMAELQSQVGQLTDSIRMLEERIRSLEGKLGAGGGASLPGSSAPSSRSTVPSSSFGSPSLPSSFGSPGGSPPGSVPPAGTELNAPRLSPITNP